MDEPHVVNGPWIPFAEALAMTLDGSITDAMTVIAVERLALIRTLASLEG